MKDSTFIRGYRVDVETMSDENDPARGTWVDCWVTSKGGGHSNSLALLEDMGSFDDGPPVSNGDLGEIRRWAEAHGYDA